MTFFMDFSGKERRYGSLSNAQLSIYKISAFKSQIQNNFHLKIKKIKFIFLIFNSYLQHIQNNISWLPILVILIYAFKMQTHNAIFRQQLKRILTIVNKKHSILRKQITKTCQVFQNDHLPVFPYEVCFGLFRQLIETASVNASIGFFPFIVHIINHGFAGVEMAREIITVLTHVKSIPKFKGLQNQSKLQQLLQLLISKNTISLENIPYAHSIINILMALDNSKYRILWAKTLGIIFQITLLYVNELKQLNSEVRKVAFIGFLGDMVQLAKGKNVKWLIEPIQPYIFTSLLSQILQEKEIVQHKNQYKQILQGLVSPLKIQIGKLYQGAMMQSPLSPTKGWQLSIQSKLAICLKTSCKISRLYSFSFQLLQQLIKIVGEKGGSSIKILSYQCLNYLFSSCEWMHAMLTSPACDLFNFLMTTLFNTVKLLQQEVKEQAGGHSQQKIGHQDHRTHHNHNEHRHEDRNFKLFGSNVLDIHLSQLSHLKELKRIVKAIDEVTFTFFSLYFEIYQIKLDKKLKERPPLDKTYKFCCKTIFQMVKAVMSKQVGQEALQSLLKIAQRFINLAGVFGDQGSAGMFIKLLCKHCLPTGKSIFSQRHVHINKMILSTANCLGNLFSTSCWVTIWRAFQNYGLYYNRYLLGRQQLQAQRQSDVQILNASIEAIFKQSHQYDDDYLLTILQSLVEATYQHLQNGNSSQQSKKVFEFDRIEQIFKLNLFRVGKIYNNLISSLLVLTTSKLQLFRLASMNLISTVIPIALHYLHSHPQGLNSILPAQRYQNAILQVWQNLANSPFPQVKLELATAVNKLIIDYGHIMTHGWSTILLIVKKLQHLQSLQAIVQTFLQRVAPYLMQLVDLIDHIQRGLADPNQKYLCLTLIWAIGDHAHRQSHSQVLRKIYALLLKPQEMFTLGTQARHSSFYILAQLLVHNCNQKQQEFWEWIFTMIQKFYDYSVLKCQQSKNTIGYQEVLKNLLSNLLKIYRKFILLMSQHQQFLSSKLDKLLNLVCRFMDFRQNQLYQATLKQIRELLTTKKDLVIGLIQFERFLQKLTQIYRIDTDPKILKSLITYLPNDIYEILNQSLPLTKSKLSLLYHLLQKVFLLRLEAQQKQINIQQLRIFFQQKGFMQAWRKLQNHVLELQPEVVKQYLQLITKTLHKLLLYEDYHFLSKLLPSITTINDLHCVDNQHVIDLMGQIIRLRISQNWKKRCGKSKDVPVWLIAVNQMVRLGYILERRVQSQICVKGFKKNIVMLSEEIGGKPLVLTNNSPQTDYMTYFYDSQCNLLHFLIENHILSARNSSDATQTQLESLLRVLQQGIFQYNDQDPTARGKNYFELLFKAAQIKQQYNQSVIKHQTAILKLLFKLCINIFNQFLERKNQLDKEWVTRQSKLKFVMKNLTNLQVSPQVFPNTYDFLLQKFQTIPARQSKLYSHPRGWLVIMSPLLIRLFECDISQLRLSAKQLMNLSHACVMELL